MKRNKMFFVKRFYFVGFFVLLGTLNLFAQDEPDVAEELSALKEEISVLKGDISILNEGYKKIIENSIPELTKNISETQTSLDSLSNSVSKSQIWQIIPAISVAFIALLLLMVVLLLLKQLIPNVLVVHKQKPADEKSVNEHQTDKESTVTPPGIASSEFNTLKNRLEDVQKQLMELNDKVSSQSKSTLRFQDDLTSLQAEMTGLKQTIKTTSDAVSALSVDFDKNKEKIAKKEQVERDPVAVFNQWAQNPHLPFPQYFTYVAIVKLEFRSKQEFTDTTIETEWIRNTIGEKKYLFPNPNTIDNLSGPIDKLYKVTGTRKAKRSNSLKITSACQIKEGNFIEYQGELTLM